eukprot:scaffold35083_cov62-Phaeocystis_antarctica.AAC.1
MVQLRKVHTHGTRRTRHANPCTLSTPCNTSGLEVTHPADTAVDIEEGTEPTLPEMQWKWWRARQGPGTREDRGRGQPCKSARSRGKALLPQ